MSISRADFGTLPDGRKAELFTLKNHAGLIAKVTNYGARTTTILTPDKDGIFGDVLLGMDSLEPYLTDINYLGATVGRYANRIGGAAFTLGDKPYAISQNEGQNHLHGGSGFHTQLWNAEIDDNILTLRHHSPDGQDGYPGNMDIELRIYWKTDSDLRMDFTAVTDAPCPVNLTNHNYFNMGYGQDIRDHSAQIFASSHLVKTDNGIPTGEITDVGKSPADLRAPAIIGHRINACALPLGYDHSYVIDGQGLRDAATVRAQDSGRQVTLLTTQPGMQFYTGVNLEGNTGRDGLKWPAYAGLCLEGQHHPDSPNHPHFPNTILHPGETYKQTQIYRFGLI